MLLGNICFDNELETSIFFKKVKVKTRHRELEDTPPIIDAPYTYMRMYDCIDFNSDILVCSEINIVENIIIEVDVFNSPITLPNFRADSNGFCPRKQKYYTQGLS